MGYTCSSTGKKISPPHPPTIPPHYQPTIHHPPYLSLPPPTLHSTHNSKHYPTPPQHQTPNPSPQPTQLLQIPLPSPLPTIYGMFTKHATSITHSKHKINILKTNIYTTRNNKYKNQ